MTTDSTATEPPNVDQQEAANRNRTRAVVLLALLSGATDAVGLLALGGAFTSVMTGNMVLLGVSVGAQRAAELGFTLAAIAGYVAGVLIGARIAGEPRSADPVWPRRVTHGLLLELACFAVFAAAWWAEDGDPRSSLIAPLLAINAAALGIQSSVIIRFGVSGLSTTYMTGTLTTMLTRVAARHPLSSLGRSGALLTALIAGAAVGAFSYAHARPLVPAVQLVLIIGVITIGLLTARREAATTREMYGDAEVPT